MKNLVCERPMKQVFTKVKVKNRKRNDPQQIAAFLCQGKAGRPIVIQEELDGITNIEEILNNPPQHTSPGTRIRLLGESYYSKN